MSQPQAVGDPEALRLAEHRLTGLASALTRPRGAVPVWAGSRADRFGLGRAELGEAMTASQRSVAQLGEAVRELARHAVIARERSADLARTGSPAGEAARQDLESDYRRAAAEVARRVDAVSARAAGLGVGRVAETALASLAPRRAHRWWRSMTAAERERALVLLPDGLGALDGLPGATRDRANRARLPGIRSRLIRDLAAARTWAGRRQDPLAAGRIQDKLHALHRVEQVLAAGGRQLLVLDARSGRQLHVAIAVGDVDRAAHVGIFVPGYSSTVQDDLPGHDRQVTRWRAGAGGSESFAAVVWLGTDLPQPADLFDRPRSVLTDRLARRGGRALAGFSRGLDQRPVHLVGIGHSYGSLVLGHALRGATGLDDAAVLGSPGIGVEDIERLKIGPGHLYSLDAEEDLIAVSGVFGTPPHQLPGVRRIDTAACGDLRGSRGHSQYLSSGSASLAGLSDLLAGRYHRLRSPGSCR